MKDTWRDKLYQYRLLIIIVCICLIGRCRAAGHPVVSVCGKAAG